MKTSSKRKSYAKLRTPVTLTVLKLLKAGKYAKQIADDLGKSRATISRHMKKLIKWGYIQEQMRSSCKIYIITEKGETAIRNNKLHETSYRTTNLKLGTHFRIYIPIQKKGRIPSWDTVNKKFKNSIIKHKDLSNYIEGVSVKETSKGIGLNIKHRKLPTIKQLFPIAMSSCMWAVGFFSAHGYILDYKNYYIEDMHNTIWTKEASEVAEKSGRVTVNFPWDRKKITPRDPNQKAKAWFDRTPEPNLETNDVDYAESYIKMPVTVNRIMNLMERQNEAMATYAEHLNAHLPVLKNMNKLIKKMDKRVSQRKLGEFL